ncbi:MAG: hypothetical protein IJ106_08360 [Parasporobacterium sp.]|nr:hypothetical protein [Parasporobacterium sp.]
MKKMIAVLLTAVLILGVIQPVMADSDTLADWDIKVTTPEGTSSILKGDEGNYYIYPQEFGVIPYVMLRTYTEFADEEEFINDYFTGFMAEGYEDLEVTSEFAPVVIDGVRYYEIDYGYTVQGYEVRDRRVVKTVNGRTYMFASKEIDELDKTIGNLLEEVIADCVYYADGEPIELEEEVVDGGDYEIPRIDITDEDIEELDLEGSYVPLEGTDVEIYVPDIMEESLIPEGQPGAEYFIAIYGLPEVEESYAAVQLVPSNFTLEDYRAMLESMDEVEDIADFIINGIHFLRYFMPERDVVCLTTQKDGDPGYILEFSFSPISDEDYGEIAEIMGMTIRPVR